MDASKDILETAEPAAALSPLPTTGPRATGPMGRKGARPSLWSAWHATPMARWARLSTFALTVLALGTLFVFQRSQAQLGDDMLGMGATLMQFADSEHTNGPRALSLNGEIVHLVSGSTEQPLADVIDAFEGVCLQRDAEFRTQITEFYRSNPEAPRREILERFRPTLRSTSPTGDRATVGCLDLGTERRTPGELLDAAAEFNRSGDLSSLGAIRYIFAQAADGGRTQYVALWTEGSFHVNHILPGNEDAPGTDLPGIPRAPDARRSLAAFEMGRDDRFVIYEGSSMTEWELEHFYRESLAEDGWLVVDTREDGSDAPLVAALRDGRQVYISLNTDVHGRGNAIVALTE